MARILKFVCGVLLLVLSSPVGWAQVTTATILGTVKDEGGGVLPGTSITVRNTDTGILRTATADAQGRYQASHLDLGSYQVEASLEGFRTQVRTGITLTLGREARVDFSLSVGGVSERITVTGEAPLIESSGALRAGLVDEKQIKDLPLNGRNFIDLTLLQTGVTQARASSAGFGNEGTHIVVSGSRPTSTTFLLDGNVTVSVRGKAPASISGQALGVEAIREFSIITNPYDAEYGRGTGGTINVVSRSGTNQLHGSLFYFLRDDSLDAANFFDNSTGNERPDFRRKQLGASFGGPIRRDRTFLFANYEGLREALGITMIDRVPSVSARAGVLGGRQVEIIPAIRPYLEIFPFPNGRDFGDGTAEFHSPFMQKTGEDYLLTRLDHQFSEKNSLLARYTISDGDQVTPTNLPQIFFQEGTSRNQSLVVEGKRIFSSALLGILRFGYTRNNLTMEDKLGTEISPSLSVQPGRLLPRLSISGLSPLGHIDQHPRYNVDNYYDVYYSMNYVRGGHSLKFGAQVEKIGNDVMLQHRMNSRWNFASLANFYAGNATQVQIAPVQFTDPVRSFRQDYVAAYLQDDIKIAPTVTVNAGLRYEAATVLGERENRIARIPADRILTARPDDMVTGPPWYDKNPDWTGFAPRVGLAWDPAGDKKTVIRSGFGMFYDHLWAWWMSGLGAFYVSPYYTVFTVRSLPFPTTLGEIVRRAQQQQGRERPMGTELYQFEGDLKKQYTMQLTLDVQHQVGEKMVVKAGYSGTRGVHLGRIVDANKALPERVLDGMPYFSLSPRRPNPNFETINVMNTDSTSSYHALQLELNRRFSNGFQFQVSYTLSKTIDDAAGVNTGGFDAESTAGGGTSIHQMFKSFDRSLSSFDTRHVFAGNFLFDVPVGQGRRVDLGALNHVLGGWQFNGLVHVTSGRPFDISQGTNAQTTLLGNKRRPDLTQGASNSPVLGGPDKYFDPSVFTFAPPNRYGYLGRNTVIGPGFASVNASLAKVIRLRAPSSDSSVSFRAEFFNLLNRPNFGAPSMAVFDGNGARLGSAGRINSTASTARQVQLGLKVNW